MPEAAIQQDVVDAPKGDDVTNKDTVVIEPAEDPTIDIEKKMSRDDVMAQITERRNKELQDEIDEAPEEVKPVEPEVETEEEEDTVPEIDVEVEPIEPEVKTVKVKVDGVESEVTEKEIREYQKQKAADKRLDELSRAKEDLSKRQAALDAKEKEIQEAQAVIDAAENDNADELATKLTSSMFEEDKEAVAEVIREIIAKRDAKAIPAAEPVKIDSTEVSQHVNDALNERDRKKAIAKFDEEYPELASRSGLRAEVNARTIVEMQEDPEASFWKVIERAAEYVKDDLAGVMGVETKSEVSDELARRAEKKSDLGNSVKTVVSKKAAMVTKPKAKKLTPFQQLQKARGQQ